MCDKETNYRRENEAKVAHNQASDAAPRESHTVYELKQRRERLLHQLVQIQKAIDAVNNVGGL